MSAASTWRASGWGWALKRALPTADLGRVVLLGAGGAGSAIAHAALRMGTGALLVVDSDADRAEGLAISLNALYGAGRASASRDAGDAMEGATGLIHATPTGMAKLPGLPLPESLLRPDLWISEVVYFPLETALLAAARRIGCATMDGGHMNVGQAADAFRLFTGREPDPARMDAHFRRIINASTDHEHA